jgi:predicted esterase
MTEWWQEAAASMEGGDVEKAVAAVRRASEAGRLWRLSAFGIPALEPLGEHPEVRPLLEAARARIARSDLKPRVVLAAPPPATTAPLLLHFHGARGSAAAELGHWTPALKRGWLVAAGQSSQPSGPDTYCWDPPEARVRQDLVAIAGQLPRHGRIVLTGFSQGAWIALQAALAGDLLPAASVVMVGPFFGAPEDLPPSARRLRIAVLVGGADHVTASRGPDLDSLRQRGHHLTVETVPGLGHEYPRDFASRLPGLLEAVTRRQ